MDLKPWLMNKARGYPDRRGMGAQSDSISETFAPSSQHQEEQIRRARVLIANGIPLLNAAQMLSIPAEWISGETKILPGPDES